jgi:hypothetical protein
MRLYWRIEFSYIHENFWNIVREAAMDFAGTFDTTNALSGMFLWIVFSFLASLINCDIQRMMRQNPLLIHMFGFTAFFFLFTLIDANNKTSLKTVWFKTFFVYLLFVMMTKAKWYFVLPVLHSCQVQNGNSERTET